MAFKEYRDWVVDTLHSSTALALVCDEYGWMERQFVLESISSRPKRLANLAIHHIASINPELFESFITHGYEKHGYEVIGFGRTSTVLKMCETAVKLIRSSASMPEAKQLNAVNRLYFDQSELMEYMSDFAVRQEFSIMPHPLKPKMNIIAATQPIVEGFKPLQFCDAEKITELPDIQKTSVKKFAESALLMARDIGQTPDIMGASNFGFDGDNNLLLLDTMPCYSNASVKAARFYLGKMLDNAS